MARKRLLSASGGGGISPGAPFVVTGMLFVQQVSPPFAATGRLAQLTDAVLSLVAPDITGAADTLVMGSGTGGGLGIKNTWYGKNIKTNNAAGSARNIGIGGNIDFSAAAGGTDNNIWVGWDYNIGTPTATANNVVVGHSFVSVNAVSGAAVLGNDVQLNGGDSVGVGDLSLATGESTAVGKAAHASGTQSLALAKSARSGGQRSIAIGMNCKADQDNEISIGFGINTTAFANPIRIGRNAEVFEANCVAIGNDQTDGTEMRVMRLGPNTLAGYAGLSIFLPSAAAGNNVLAPPTVIRGGESTGNAAKGGKLTLQTSLIGAGGGAYQAFIDVFRVQSGGTAGNPTIAFLNQIVNAGAVLAAKTLDALGAGTRLRRPGGRVECALECALDAHQGDHWGRVGIRSHGAQHQRPRLCVGAHANDSRDGEGAGIYRQHGRAPHRSRPGHRPRDTVAVSKPEESPRERGG